MSEQNKKRNGGYITVNTKKTQEKQPDFRGKVTFEGKELAVSGWKKKITSNGEQLEIISLELTDPANAPPRPANNAAPRAAAPAQASPAPAAPAPASGGASDQPDFLADIFGGSQF